MASTKFQSISMELLSPCIRHRSIPMAMGKEVVQWMATSRPLWSWVAVKHHFKWVPLINSQVWQGAWARVRHSFNRTTNGKCKWICISSPSIKTIRTHMSYLQILAKCHRLATLTCSSTRSRSRIIRTAVAAQTCLLRIRASSSLPTRCQTVTLGPAQRLKWAKEAVSAIWASPCFTRPKAQIQLTSTLRASWSWACLGLPSVASPTTTFVRCRSICRQRQHLQQIWAGCW